MFLVESDYSSQVRDEVLEIITDNSDPDTWQGAELKAQAMIESYLNNRFDVASIFIDVDAYSAAATYNAGEHVTLNGKIYYALQAANGNNPEEAASAYWKKGDLRNKQIISICIDITLYKLYTANNARAIPEHVKENYQDALNWLTQVSKGIIGPGLPLLPEDNGNPVKYGSESKQTHYW